MIDAIMIQGAVLGMQQAKEASFDTAIGHNRRMGWWWKADVANTYTMEVVVYLDKKSPTGYMLEVDYLDEESVTILNRPLLSFEEFQEIFQKKFLPTVFRDWKKAMKKSKK